MTVAGIGSINLKPEEIAYVLRDAVDDGTLIGEAALWPPQGERLAGFRGRMVIRPEFLRTGLQCHPDRYGEKSPDGLLFMGEKGLFRRSTFGRRWQRARTEVRMPDFRLYGLRYTVHTFSARSGATLKDTVARAGQATEKAALIHQHSGLERQKEVASGLGGRCRPPERGRVSSRRKA
ncbi:hypothetical protein ACIOMQ_06520 [Streptomyces sp. NPDC087845]|uniref:hypothetical protein n=1 Tax=Streptomyces sp. NPDC087845 TaxID=3365806 RepID=UPI00380F7C78